MKRDAPTVTSEYRIIRVLGRGGMGVVYEAEQVTLGRRVALKVLSDEGSSDPTSLARLRREALSMGALQHPHIVRVSAFEEGPPPFVVMELLAGQSLRERLNQRGPMTSPDACLVAVQLLAALGAAHRAGIVHRDVKPANVFVVTTPLSDVFVKLLDFGVAKLLTPQAGPALTSFDSIIGSGPYMAPEQIRGEAIDGRTDIFALGVTLYEMLAGRRPFVAGPNENVMMTILRGGPVAPLVGVPAPVEAIVHRALAPTASSRFASTEDMSAALMPFVTRTQLADLDATIQTIMSPRSQTSIDVRGTQSTAWGPPTVAHTVDQTSPLGRASLPSAGQSARGPQPHASTPWGAIVLGAVVVVLLLGCAVVGLFFLGGSGGLAGTPGLPSVKPGAGSNALAGSCLAESICTDYTKSFLEEKKAAVHCRDNGSGKWRGGVPCERARKVGGCRLDMGVPGVTGPTIWYYDPVWSRATAGNACPPRIGVFLEP